MPATTPARVNLLVAPCVSPWAYERIHRWNPDAIDPNRSFRDDSPAQESAALMRAGRAAAGPRRCCTSTCTRPPTPTSPSSAPRWPRATASRTSPGEIPDGFYLVDDSENPQPAFQQAIIAAVAQVTHIAPADANGEIIGSPVVAPGVIHYPVRDAGPVRRHHRRALHHHHRGLSGQPARNAGAVQRRAGGGGAGGARLRARRGLIGRLQVRRLRRHVVACGGRGTGGCA